MILGGWTVRTFAPAAALAVAGLLFAACGEQENARPSAPATTAQAQSGRGVISGTINVVNGCGNPATVLLRLQSATNNSIVHQNQYLPNGYYQVDLDPGSYVLTVEAPPCVFTEAFNIIAGQSLVKSPVL